MFCYKAHNLIISSEMELPELIPFDGEPDIEILFGSVPPEIENRILKKRFYELSKTEYLLEASGIGKFYVKNGNVIIVEKDSFVSLIELRIYLLSRVWGVLLAQRQQFVIHACSVVFKNDAYLLTGSPMSKAFLGSYFREQGQIVLTDALSLIELNNKNVPYVYQGFQNVRYDPVIPVNKDDLVCKPVRLSKVFVIETRDTKEFQSELLLRSDIFKALLKNIHQAQIIKEMELGKEAFQFLIALIQKIEAKRIIVPKHGISVSALQNYLEKIIRY